LHTNAHTQADKQASEHEHSSAFKHDTAPADTEVDGSRGCVLTMSRICHCSQYTFSKVEDIPKNFFDTRFS
jgi:hypothetical protein